MAVTEQEPGRLRGVHVSRRTGLVYDYAITYAVRGAVVRWKAKLASNGAFSGKLRGELAGLGPDRDPGLYIAVVHVEAEIDRGAFET